jgi:tRNA threonylcarbamoyladenosine biosynthesis protein TsaB
VHLLALDTSTRYGAIALGRADGSLFHAVGDPQWRHGRALVPNVRDLLREAGLSPRELGGVAVGLGPGSYTGLRVGVTAAKTFAYATGCLLAGFDSLEAIARNAPGECLRVSVIADAQRGDLFVADFARTHAGAALNAIKPTRIERINDWQLNVLAGTLVLGPALEQTRDLVPVSASTLDHDLNYPKGPALVALAREIFNAGRHVDPWFLEPTYHRKSAAEDQWERRA